MSGGWAVAQVVDGGDWPSGVRVAAAHLAAQARDLAVQLLALVGQRNDLVLQLAIRVAQPRQAAPQRLALTLQPALLRLGGLRGPRLPLQERHALLQLRDALLARAQLQPAVLHGALQLADARKRQAADLLGALACSNGGQR